MPAAQIEVIGLDPDGIPLERTAPGLRHWRFGLPRPVAASALRRRRGSRPARARAARCSTQGRGKGSADEPAIGIVAGRARTFGTAAGDRLIGLIGAAFAGGGDLGAGGEDLQGVVVGGIEKATLAVDRLDPCKQAGGFAARQRLSMAEVHSKAAQGCDKDNCRQGTSRLTSSHVIPRPMFITERVAPRSAPGQPSLAPSWRGGHCDAMADCRGIVALLLWLMTAAGQAIACTPMADSFEGPKLDAEKWSTIQLLPGRSRFEPIDEISGPRALALSIGPQDRGCGQDCQRNEIRESSNYRTTFGDECWYAFRFRIEGEIP